MSDQGAYGARMGAVLHLDSTPATIVRKLGDAPLAVTRLRSNAALPEKTTPIPPEKAFVISLHLVDPFRPSGGVSIVDLEQDAIVFIGTPFDMVQFYVPRAALDEIAQDYGAERIDTLSWPYAKIDPVIEHLAQGILPVLERPELTCSPYTDHVLLALLAYVAQTYGGMQIPQSPVRGGLAPWQLRRAKEVLNSHISEDMSLSQVASECELSRSHFTRAFKQCTGITPHRWLIGRRVETAKELLLQSELSLAEIALRCGFADQSHFNKVFHGFVGASPGAWRRARTH
jgi:AraC family transcriptional regulator